MNMIEVKDVSICFRMANDKLNSLKEFMIQKVKGKLKYEEFWALKDVSFNVKKGEVVGIVGHNGAGKSTILKVISGIMKPTEGTVVTHGNIVPMLELEVALIWILVAEKIYILMVQYWDIQKSSWMKSLMKSLNSLSLESL